MTIYSSLSTSISFVFPFLFQYTSSVTTNYAVANFDAENNGIDGAVEVTNGIITIDIDITYLDTDQLTDGMACFSGGLKYHIHELWNYNDTNDKLGSDACGSSYTGGHWDPWLACGSATGNEYCSAKGGCVTGSSVLGSDTYDCSSDTFESNPYACEVGDWSGKYGSLVLGDDNKTLTLTASSPYEVSAWDLIGYSIVFHCNGGARAFCAPFDVYIDGEDAQRPTQSSNSDMMAVIDESNYVILMNNGSYLINIDVGSYSCSTGDSLLYRIYQDFDDSEGSCSGSLYDPTITCADGSENEFCVNNMVCNDTYYSYSCDYTNDPYLCGVGDLSGKYGELSLSGDGVIMGYDDIMIDLSLLDGMGIVLQCSDDLEIVGCAAFEAVETMSSSMEPTESSMEPNEDSSANTMNVFVIKAASLCVFVSLIMFV